MGVNKSIENNLWSSTFQVDSKNSRLGIIKLSDKQTEDNYICRKVSVIDKKQVQEMDRLIDLKLSIQSPYVTKLERADNQSNKQYCAYGKSYYLLFKQPFQSLKQQTLNRKFKNSMYSQSQLQLMMQVGVKGLLFLKNVHHAHKNISSTSFFVNENRSLVLGDPFMFPKQTSPIITQNGFIYPSPEMIRFQNHQIQSYDEHSSDLFTFGLVLLQVFYMINMDCVYEKYFQAVNHEAIWIKLNVINNQQLKKKLFILLNPQAKNRQIIYKYYLKSISSAEVFRQLSKQQFKKNIERYNLATSQVTQWKNELPFQQRISSSDGKNTFSVSTADHLFNQDKGHNYYQRQYGRNTNSALNTHLLGYQRNNNYGQTNYRLPSSVNQHGNLLNNYQGYPVGQQMYPVGQQMYPAGQQMYPVRQQMYPVGQQDINVNKNLAYPGQNHSSSSLVKPNDFPHHQLKNSALSHSQRNIIHLKGSSPKFQSSNLTLTRSQNMNTLQNQSKYFSHQYPHFNSNNYQGSNPFQHTNNKEMGRSNSTLHDGFKVMFSKPTIQNQRIQKTQLPNNNLSYNKQFFIHSQKVQRYLQGKNQSKATQKTYQNRLSQEFYSQQNSRLNLLTPDNIAIQLKKTPNKQKKKRTSEYGRYQNLSTINERSQLTESFFTDSQDKDSQITIIEDNFQVQNSKRISKMAPQLTNQIGQSEQKGKVWNIEYPSGTKYIGELKYDKRNGLGTFFYIDGSKYHGKWLNNKMNGFGVLYYPSGKIAYQGQWRLDNFHGKGKVFNDQTSVFEGKYNYEDCLDIDSHWLQYDGQLIEDRREGRGLLKLVNGQVFDGRFKNDQLHGLCKFYTIDNQVVQGIWQGNKLIKIVSAQRKIQ